MHGPYAHTLAKCALRVAGISRPEWLHFIGKPTTCLPASLVRYPFGTFMLCLADDRYNKLGDNLIYDNSYRIEQTTGAGAVHGSLSCSLPAINGRLYVFYLF